MCVLFWEMVLIFFVWKMIDWWLKLLNCPDPPWLAHPFDCRKLTRNSAYYFKSKMGSGFLHSFLKYCGCELLNLVVTLFNFWLADRFLKNKFWTYGWDTLQYLSQNETTRIKAPNPMCSTFPTMVRLHFAHISIVVQSFFLFWGILNHNLQYLIGFVYLCSV